MQLDFSSNISSTTLKQWEAVLDKVEFNIEQTPKTIFYCWFGHGELSAGSKKSLVSWERYAPGYSIVCCDESMFDVDSHPWTKSAYNAGKYAYVSDYARFWAIYQFGGVYMDLGSELIRDITSLCDKCSPFSAIEESTKTATPGLIIASPPHSPMIAEVLSLYDSVSFSNDPAFLREHTVNQMFSSVLGRHGFVREDRLQEFEGWTILPSTAFSPIYGLGGYHIKSGTYSIHRSSSSWSEPKYKVKREIQDKCSPFLGRRLAQILGRVVGEFKCEGPVGGLRNIGAVVIDVLRRRTSL